MSTNKIYQTPGTAVTFKNTGGDVTLTLKNLADAAGRVSNQWDRGAGSLPVRLKVECAMKAAAALAIGVPYRIYLHAAQSSSSMSDYTADGGVSVETGFRNFALIGQVSCNVAGAGPFYSSFVVECYGRYVSFGVWNASGQTIENNDGTSYITVTPFADDIQAAA